ncbi:hypothetical protein [Streptomyces hainanensis]|uniref:Uncharacterized protein n=1 Tax=Streptomyces hainanensis TaxID=402648 RepID=A0A4R4SUD1_9ACTN|nr:hypothetical protein [Streptomyces hainanensis]TDC65922.1 hypothetical protein E1283_30235 [Streptomyces hainanensis]
MITVGGRRCVVTIVERLHNGSRLRFASGELLALPRSAVVTVARPRPAHRRRRRWASDAVAQVVAGCVLVIVLTVAVVVR